MKPRSLQAISLFLALLLWEIIPRALSIREYVFPPFSSVIGKLLDTPLIFFEHSAKTGSEAVVGIFIAILIGSGLALMMARFPKFGTMINLYIVGANAVPIIAIAPIVAIWFGYGFLSKAVVAAFLSFFPLTATYYKGLVEVNSDYHDLFVSFGASREQFFWKYSVPNATPALLIGIKVSATLSVVGAVVAEFMGASSGLGFGMLQAVYSLNTARLFAFALMSVLLGLSFYVVFHAIEVAVLKKFYGATIRRLDH